jgi:hypothetical protein
MPKNKSKRKNTKSATNGADLEDDFDQMLAEVTAADPEFSADVRSISSSGGAQVSSPGLQVSEDAIASACKRGDIALLRGWGRQGVRVENANTLVDYIFTKFSFNILNCLVKELGADVNGARLSDGATPLFLAAQMGHLVVVRYLVKEQVGFGAMPCKTARRGR